MNELAHSSSQYLQQHANNPVHWKTWNPRIWEQAQADKQLVIVSIGYAACHWCHVMEHESFEQQEVAEVMNAHFYSIKVDREEHPDVDAVYMKAVQLMTRQGGWPLNVVCLPDGRPIWGATYVPKDQWMQTLTQLAQLYREKSEQVIHYAEQLTDGLHAIALPLAQNKLDSLDEFFEKGIQQWQEHWDWDWGGDARAPKFMMPTQWDWLLFYGRATANETVLKHVYNSLRRMSMGGTYDRFNGGFCRYSVDARWHVPHFEKMAYDNGLLLATYSQLYAHQPEDWMADILRKTATFLARELQGNSGMYFGSLDADSLNAVGKLQEGAYYAFTLDECKNAIPEMEWEWFAAYFQLNRWAHWEAELYVPFQVDLDEDFCVQNRIDLNEFTTMRERWIAALANLRNTKTPPQRDTKCITAWNAQLATGLCMAGNVLKDPEVKKQGLDAARFLANTLDTAEGLYHQYGKNGVENTAYCDGYAFTIKAYLQAYLTDWDENWLVQAKKLMDTALDHFWNESAGYFQFTSHEKGVWVAPHYEIEDNVIPSSNAIMAENLLRLSWYFKNEYYQEIANEMCTQLVSSAEYFPGFTQWYASCYVLENGYHSVQLSEHTPTAIADEFAQAYQPLQLIYRHKPQSSLSINAEKAPEAPFATTIQICKGKTCFAPQTDEKAALQQWKSF